MKATCFPHVVNSSNCCPQCLAICQRRMRQVTRTEAQRRLLHVVTRMDVLPPLESNCPEKHGVNSNILSLY